PGRVYPLTIDPEWNFGVGRSGGGGDAFVGSGCGNCNFNGDNQIDDNSWVDKMGWQFWNGGNWEFYSYLWYDLTAARDATILKADWTGRFHAIGGTFWMWRVTGNWNEN